ncbi:MAG: DUF1905 domain-containing protein [Candidatus Taylorbacteria bacterium]|nr:DUF1905 domain-containing protein [Candidatus Taylorbacteria bacterium]
MAGFRIEGKANVFPGIGGWVWVGVPDEVAKRIIEGVPPKLFRFVPIVAKVGKTEWKTALLPLGEGKYFIALKAKVRKAEGIFAGDSVVLHVKPPPKTW